MSTRWWDKWHTNWYIPAQEFDVIGSSIFLQSIRPRDAFPLRSPCQELSLSRRINSLAWMAARDRPIRWKTRRATRRRRKMWIYAPAVGRRTYEKKIDVIHKISRENTAVTTAWRAVTGHKLLSPPVFPKLSSSPPNSHLLPSPPPVPLTLPQHPARAIQGTTVLLSFSDTPTTRSNDLSSVSLRFASREKKRDLEIFVHLLICGRKMAMIMRHLSSKQNYKPRLWLEIKHYFGLTTHTELGMSSVRRGVPRPSSLLLL